MWRKNKDKFIKQFSEQSFHKNILQKAPELFRGLRRLFPSLNLQKLYLLAVLNFLPFLHRRSNGKIRRMVRDQRRLQGVVQVRFSRPDGADHVVVLIQLVEPGFT